ncbi:MAG TPA: hypothetical protein VHM19_19265, partial [Polyangiales bacterium]|nr:hypothetical protein [Polyangiales bacterium]
MPKKQRAFRLAKGVRPDAYRVHIEVDPSRGKDYTGNVAIDLVLSAATARIELHAADLEVTAASLRSGRNELDAKIALHPERETVELTLLTKNEKGRPIAARAGKGKATLEL